jgi:O-antigen/teichoic acid export membrane protein
VTRHEGSAASSQLVILAAFGAHLVVSLALTVALGRALAPAEFGFFALVATIFAFGRDATDLGTTAAGARNMRRDPACERSLLEGLVVWRRAVGGVLAVGVLGLAMAQADPERRWVLVAAALGLVAMGPAAFNAVFQARQAQAWPAAIVFLSQLLLLAGCLALVAAGAGGVATAGLVAAREVFVAVAIGFYGCWLVGYRPVPGLRGRGLRVFAGAASVWALAALCRQLYTQMDVLTVYAFRGEMELGALAAAWRPLSPAFLIPWLATAPLVPVLTIAVTRDPMRHRKLLRQSFRVAIGVGALVTACGVALAPDLVTILYAGRYAEAPLDAATAMRWLSLAVVPVHVMAVAAVALLAAGRESLVLRVIAVGLAAKVAANVVLVPSGGFLAAVIITATLEAAVAIALFAAAMGTVRPAMPSVLSWAALLPAGAVAIASPFIASAPATRVASLLALGGAGFVALLVSPVGRAYFGALRDAGAEQPAGATLNAEDLEGES